MIKSPPFLTSQKDVQECCKATRAWFKGADLARRRALADALVQSGESLERKEPTKPEVEEKANEECRDIVLVKQYQQLRIKELSELLSNSPPS